MRFIREGLIEQERLELNTAQGESHPGASSAAEPSQRHQVGFLGFQVQLLNCRGFYLHPPSPGVYIHWFPPP